MTNGKRVISAVVVTTLAGLLAACGSSSSSSSGSAASSASSSASYSLVTPGELTVAVYGSYAPYITVTPSGQLGGVDGALLNGFASSVGLKVHVFQTTFTSSILAVEQHKADIGTYIYYTSQRAASVYYTLPFMSDYAVVFTLKSFPYQSPASLSGKSVGTVQGFVWAPYLQKTFGSNAKLYPDTVTVGTALLNGQIQGYVDGSTSQLSPPINTPKVVAHLLKAGDFGFPESVIATIAYNDVNCGNKSLALAYDNYVRSIAQDGKFTSLVNSNVGQVESTYHVHLPSLVPALTVPQEVC